MGYETWSPSPPKLEKPRSVFNAASLAFIGDSIFEVCFFHYNLSLCFMLLGKLLLLILVGSILIDFPWLEWAIFFPESFAANQTSLIVFSWLCSYMLVGIFFSLRSVLKIITIMLEQWCAVKHRFVIFWLPVFLKSVLYTVLMLSPFLKIVYWCFFGFMILRSSFVCFTSLHC